YGVFDQLSRLQDLHAGGFDRDLRGAPDRAEEDPRRPDRAGGADASEHGRPSRPQCRAGVHAGVRRRQRARRACRRDRRPLAGDAIRHGLAARADPVRGHRVRRPRFAARRLHRLAADRADPDLCGGAERFAGERVRTARPEPRAVGFDRHLERDDRADRADPALCALGADADLPPDGPARGARVMSEAPTAPRPATQTHTGNAGFYGIWLIAAAALIVLPQIFSSGGSLTSFSLIGIAIVFALSYNILLGQTGLLSFGHAVQYGLGGFLAVHVMNAVASYNWPLPLPLIPLAGGIGGLAFAIVIGWVMTKRAGTVFAMISLGIGELVASSSLILRSVFGGEAGITTDRTALPHVFGWTFGSQLQVYYLIAFWTMISAIAMYALTRTPLGRI